MERKYPYGFYDGISTSAITPVVNIKRLELENAALREENERLKLELDNYLALLSL